MVYNSNTSIQRVAGTPSVLDYRSNMQTSAQAGQSSQWGLDVWGGPPVTGITSTGAPGIVNRALPAPHDNLTFNPYKGHLSILQHPNVNYGPLEDPTFQLSNAGHAGFNAYAQNFPNARYIVQMQDPLGRSELSGSVVTMARKSGMENEFSYMQIEQTMRELKNRATIESTAAYNRNLPPNKRVNKLDSTESVMERLIPGLMSDASLRITRPTLVPLQIMGSPHMNSMLSYNIKTGRIEGAQRFLQSEQAFSKKAMERGPELIEDFFEENTLWKQNLLHDPDYKEGPDTKDKTKETIKTIEASGKLVTTELKDASFTKTKEYERPDIEGAEKQALLEEKMKKRKQSGIMLGTR